jgi:hypothetical protein
MLFNFRPGKKDSRRDSRAILRPWRRYRAFLEVLEDRCLPSSFLVTTTADTGPGSLRQAILNADADGSPGIDYITFAIGTGVQTIAPLSVLPGITRPTVVDATTQPGYAGKPLIVLSGVNLSGNADGLYIPAGGCTIKGFVINGFTEYGIDSRGNDNTIQANYIGTDVTGTIARGNLVGVSVIEASGNLVGGPFPAVGNIISGNWVGVSLDDGTANQVEGNTIGLSAAGAALGNTGDGVYVIHGGGNIIGRTDETVGVASYLANTIAANSAYGVELSFGTTRNTVEENFIGTDANNHPNLGNTQGGIYLSTATTDNQIGAVMPAADGGFFNVISGNGGNGVLIADPGTTGNLVEGNAIGTGSSGFAALANGGSGVLIQDAASGNTIGGSTFITRNFFGGYLMAGAGNLISGNGAAGVEILEATSNVVQGNFIGTNVSGLALTGTSNLVGVDLLKGAANNQIGGPSSIDGTGKLMGLGNLISGNLSNGVFGADTGGSGPAQLHVTGNHLEGNFVGTDVTGTLALPNEGSGIYFDSGAVGNVIGGTAQGTRNIISGNGGAGIQIADVFGHGPASNNVVENNYIGTDVTGSNSVANYSAGVVVQSGATGNTIGGTAQGTGNVISGNGNFHLFVGDGVDLFDAGTAGNVLLGNFIGTDASGTMSLGNAGTGVIVTASSNTIGGAGAGAGNVISANNRDGIELDGSGNVVLGNYVGTDVHGTAALGNGFGILIEGPNNSIGAFVSGSGLVTAGNLISGNGTGIRMDNYLGVANEGNLIAANRIGTDVSGTRKLGNSIYGIRLDGAPGNTIGGTAAGAGNLISGNGIDGVALESASNGNLVLGNLIGTTADGSAALGNGGNGVLIDNGADNNTIGGTTAGAANVIAANAQSGIAIGNSVYDNTDIGNLVQGNFIGTNAAGAAGLGNAVDGVDIAAHNNTIGGADTNAPGSPLAGAGNVISGNTIFGVEISGSGANNNWVAGNYIGVDASGKVRLANGGGVGIHGGAQNNTVGANGDGVNDTAERNVISGNGSNAASGVVGFSPDNVDIYSANTSQNAVAGNFIGTDATGTVALPGVYESGVFIGYGAQSNRIGVNPSDVGAVSERNLISGNLGNAVLIFSTGTDQNIVAGNYIGTDITGTRPLLNGFGVYAPIQVSGGSNNTIGGATTLERNIIIADRTFAVRIRDDSSSIAPVTGNQVLSNYIGVDVTGTHALGTTTMGVGIKSLGTQPVTGTIIGAPGAGNVISGNSQNGIDLNGAGVTGTVIQANYIGTDFTGSAALGNTNDGILIEAGASFNTVGGTTAGQGNVISGNGANGVAIQGATANTTGNVVKGNFIGTDHTGETATGTDGKSLGNGSAGVLIEDGANGNYVGGTLFVLPRQGLVGAGNVISGNTNAGVVILQASGNFVQGNFIGIDRCGADALPNEPSCVGGAGVELLDGTAGNTVGGESSIDANGNLQGFGNVISGNGLDGILIATAPGLSNGPATRNSVQGNFIGTDPSGTTAIPNQRNGIQIASGAQNNTIGGNNSIFLNLISGNGANGIHLTGGATDTNNEVQRDFIGTDASGEKPLGNANDGVLIDAGATVNTIASSVISGNYNTGVVISGAPNNAVEGDDDIGTDQLGTHALANGVDGVLVTGGASNNLIANSFISGNTANGVRISGAGTTNNQVVGNQIGTGNTPDSPLGNGNDGVLIEAGASLNTVGSTGGANNGNANIISGNMNNGVHLGGAGTSQNIVEGNYIGTDGIGTGRLAVANAANGVLIDGGASRNTIGGAFPVDSSGNVTGPNNVISGNLKAGIDIAQASGNLVQGNYIGTDTTGAFTGTDGKPLGNAVAGVLIELGASGNTIGGDSSLTSGKLSGLGNLISGNLKAGVDIHQASANAVQGNLIGTDVTGAAATNLGNHTDGVVIEGGATNNTIGGIAGVISGATPGTGNIVSHNLAAGVHIDGAGTSGNQIVGNFIGVSAGGVAPLGNHAGVLISGGASENTIGGTTAGSLNVISGNSENGVDIDSASANLIQGNRIGLSADGTVAAGNNEGISIYHGATSNTIASNVISGNRQDGVGIFDSGTTGNQVQANFIGTDVHGQNAFIGPGQGNGEDGVRIEGGASGNTIGGYSSIANSMLTGAGNVISGNQESGVHIDYASGNAVHGNFIGTNVGGSGAVPNGASTYLGDGVDLLAGATGNMIGGADGFYFLGNLISGNSVNGVFLAAEFGTAPVTNNLVEGNFIGTDKNATMELPNGANGVRLEGGAQNNTIGGTDPTLRNIISGNGVSGVASPSGAGVQIADFFNSGPVTGNVVEGNNIGTDFSGTTALGNLADGVVLQHGVTGNTIGGSATGERNVISGNTDNGVHLTGGGTSGNLVQGNFIGTKEDGISALANGDEGVRIDRDASGNTIGGASHVDDSGHLAGAGNVIVATFAGVFIQMATDNFVQGNFIGTDLTGKSALPEYYGVDLREGAAGNQIGGPSSLDGRGNLSGLGNLISGSSIDGLFIGAYVAGLLATGNQVEGNFIGTDVTGTMPLPNGDNGVDLESGAVRNTIGGTVAGTRNIISGNGPSGAGSRSGVRITGGIAGETIENNLVENNYIGMDVTGLHAVGNGSGGVIIEAGAQNNQIGAAGAGNLISGNPEGVIIDGANTNGNIVEANTIGLAADGTTMSTVATDGVLIRNQANNNQIGIAGAGNIVSGNYFGIQLTDQGTTANLVQGNYIGTDATGTLPRGNMALGIWTHAGASANRIGGAGQGNVISANGSLATLQDLGETGGVVLMDPGTSNNVLQDNLIGTDASGTKPLGNIYAGVEILGQASKNQITAAARGNVISANVPTPDSQSSPAQGGIGVFITGSGTRHNDLTGNYIGTDITGTRALGNVEGVEVSGGATADQIGPTVLTQLASVGGAANVISANQDAGVEITGKDTSAAVSGNKIGTDVSGTLPLGNLNGIRIDASAEGIVGARGVGNLISGNNQGVVISNQAQAFLYANYIGTDVYGSKAVPNDIGVLGDSGADILVRAGNVISGNGPVGIEVNTADFIEVLGSFIGTDATGEHALGNGGDGIVVGAVRVAHIGQPETGPETDEGNGNVISGNAGNGILVRSQSSMQGISIQANLIGTDAAGTAPLPNAGAGIVLASASKVTIGGTDAGDSNVIAANTLGGMFINGGTPGAGNNVIQGNFIGTDLHATIPLGNGAYGVSIQNSSNNTIGGTTAGAGNVIANNTQGGVQVTQGTGNAIHANAMFANGTVQVGPGIVLASGGNNNQVAPSLIGATYVQATEKLTVGGLLLTRAGVTFTVDFFAGPAGDPEGKMYLGSKSFTAKPFLGKTSFLAVLAFTTNTPLVNGNPLITATVTDPNGNTSAFSSTFDPPPQNSASVFVDRLYAGLLGRLPDDAELAHWTNLMQHGTTARQVAADLMRGLEYRTIEAQTAYHTYLGRDASAAELTAATHFLAVGGTVEQLQVRLVTSAEYRQFQGATAAGFVNGLYQEALGHAPDAAALAAGVRNLHSGRVAEAVFRSTEYRRDLIENAYASLLGQPPDQKTEIAYLGMLAHGSRDEAILAAIFGSAEYRKWVAQ